MLLNVDLFTLKVFPKGSTKQSCKLLEYLMTWKAIYGLVLKFLWDQASGK